MSNPSPAVFVNGLAPPQSVAGGASFAVTLQSPAGANYWALTCTATDELGNPATTNATAVVTGGGPSRTVTFIAPAQLGSSMTFTSQVGILGFGLDANRILQASFSTTFQINVLTAGGLPVLCVTEQLEYSAIAGWIGKVNSLVRQLSPSGSNQTDNVILVAHGQSPVSCVVNSAYEVDASGGTVVLNMPTMTPGQWVSVKLQNTPATNNVTVNAPSGKQLENPPGIGGGAGTLASAVVFNSALQVGDDILWRCVANTSPYGTGNLEIASK